MGRVDGFTYSFKSYSGLAVIIQHLNIKIFLMKIVTLGALSISVLIWVLALFLCLLYNFCPEISVMTFLIVS